MVLQESGVLSKTFYEAKFKGNLLIFLFLQTVISYSCQIVIRIQLKSLIRYRSWIRYLGMRWKFMRDKMSLDSFRTDSTYNITAWEIGLGWFIAARVQVIISYILFVLGKLEPSYQLHVSWDLNFRPLHYKRFRPLFYGQIW